MGRTENIYQRAFIKRLKKEFPGSIILKNDPNYIQGIPDLLLLVGERWFALEVKRSSSAPHQPNQDYYVNRMNEMSAAYYVYPENEDEIIDEILRSL
nr:MAG TPA: Nuclease [Caudoviricetes sp.]